MSEYYINCKYIVAGKTCNKIIPNGSIIIEDNTIIAIGKNKDVKSFIVGHDKIERLNHIAIPSLVNCHTHLPETLLRGICDNSKLDEWLFDYIWPFEQRLTAADAYYGALLGCLELIESGISGFIDQYFFAQSIENAVNKAKIRALICPSVFDNTPESGSLENTWKFVSSFLRKKCRIKKDNSNSNLIKYGVGPHAPYTVPEDYLYKISEFACKYEIPIHIHLNETEKEVFDFKSKVGLSPIEYMESIGLMKNKILGAHCVHTTKNDQKIMQNADFTVLHNPHSNLKLSNGIAPVYLYLKQNIPVGIGTDGNASNNKLGLLEELKTAILLQKHLSNNPTIISNNEALSLGTTNGMKAMGFEDNGISLDSLADITILSLDASHSWPQNNPLSNIIYSSSSRDVNDLIVNGDFVYMNKTHKTLDKRKILEKCSKISQRILSEMGK